MAKKKTTQPPAPYTINIYVPQHTAPRRRRYDYISFSKALDARELAHAAFGKEEYSFGVLNDVLKHFRLSLESGLVIKTQRYHDVPPVKGLSFSNGFYEEVESPMVLGGRFIRSSREFMQQKTPSWEKWHPEFQDDEARQFLKTNFGADAGIITMQNHILPLSDADKKRAMILTYSDGTFEPLTYADWKRDDIRPC
jgi:hypothetical protein